jgi:hypothetical protein
MWRNFPKQATGRKVCAEGSGSHGLPDNAATEYGRSHAQRSLKIDEA